MKVNSGQLQHIAETYYADVYKYCYKRVNDPDDAFDLTQEVFSALSTYYKTIEYKCIRRWLYSTAHNMVVDYYKAKRRYNENTASFNALGEDAISAPDQADIISDEDINKYTSDILSSLTDEERTLYNEVYLEKISYASLSHRYKISAPALRKRISRLHKKIEKRIKSILY